MRWVLAGVGVLVAVAVTVTGVGTLLPAAHTATVERSVAASPERTWAVITAVEAHPAWRPGVESVERLPDREGRPVWREVSSTGTLTMEATVREPPRRLVTRIADEDLPFGGTWTFVLEPEGEGTRVTITEDGVVHSAFFRFVSRFVMGYEGTMIKYLDGLEARLAGAGP